jgi:hypothetical protein
LPVPEVEPRFLDRPAYSVVTRQTDISRIACAQLFKVNLPEPYIVYKAVLALFIGTVCFHFGVQHDLTFRGTAHYIFEYCTTLHFGVQHDLTFCGTARPYILGHSATLNFGAQRDLTFWGTARPYILGHGTTLHFGAQHDHTALHLFDVFKKTLCVVSCFFASEWLYFTVRPQPYLSFYLLGMILYKLSHFGLVVVALF